MVQMLSLLTMYISFICSCLVLFSWPPFCFAFYKDDCTTRGVSHCGLAINIKKYLKAKEELWKLKYFTIQKL
jgi:hypothetical protein